MGKKKAVRSLTSWLLAFAMVFTTVIVPTEVVKANGNPIVEFVGTLDENDHTKLNFSVGGKNVVVSFGTKDNDSFTPIVLGGRHNAQNNTEEYECQNEIQNYWLYVDNTAGADYNLNVDGKNESVSEDGYFQFHSSTNNVIQVTVESKNGDGNHPGPNNVDPDLTIKLGEDYLCRDGKVEQGVEKDGIALIVENDQIRGVSLNGADYPEDTLEITGSTTFEVWGVNTFNKISLKRGAGFEMWGRMTFKDNKNYEYEGSIEDCYARLVVWDGIRGEGPNDMAKDVRFRDSLIVQVGGKASASAPGYESSNSIGFENIDNIRLYNYDFHDRDATNAYIYSATTFSNVRSVDIASAKVNVWTKKLCDKGAGNLSKVTVTDFAEGELTVATDTLGDIELKNKYYKSYPAGKVENQTDAGEAGAPYVDVVQVNTDVSVESKEEQYRLAVTTNTVPKEYDLVSTDPILYSVAYHPDGIEAFENTDKGSVTMEGYQKGYYIIDDKDGHFEAWIAAGETVTVKILPEQGYQYTKDTLNINGVSINTIAGNGESEEDIGKYTFVMPTNAGHMCAGFTETTDVVEVEATSGVTGASVNAGANITRGNALLSVDKATPAQEDINKIKAAENKSGVSYQYVDLKLSEYVVKNYDKGASKQDAWKKNLTELGSKATISLVVNGATANSEFDVVRLHDGKAEKLEGVEFNSTTKTVSFETDKFSTYALVKKTTSTNNNTNNNNNNNNNNSSSSGSSGGGGGGSSSGDKTTVSTNTVSGNKVVSGNTTSGNTVSGNTTAVSENAVTTTGSSEYTDSKSGASYTLNADSTLTYEGPVSKDVTKVTIPSKVVIDGKEYKVTEISGGAFKGCKKLTTVTIPATVETIGDNAFAGCTKLKKIVVKKNVEVIGKKAFKGCKNLKTMNIKSKKIEKIGKNALKGVPKDTTIKVPKAKKTKYEKMLRESGFKGKIK